MALRCQECLDQTQFLYRSNGRNVCLKCYEPEKKKKKQEWKEFVKAIDPILKAAEPKPKKVDTNPEMYPVRNWIKELITIEEKIHKARLEGLMADKGYKEGTIKSQMKRIARDFFVTHDFVFLSKEVAQKEGVKV